MDWYRKDLTTLAFCWRLQRRDGVAIGFTSHDRDLVMDGLVYRAAPGMVPSAIERRETLDGSGVEISGALSSGLIGENDLAAGRWDGARLLLMAVDWTAPGDAPLFLASGELGGVESDGRSFSAELRGPATLLDGPVTEETSPECRAALGDRRCGVDMAGRRVIRPIVSAAGEAIRFAALPGAVGDFAFGRLRWLDGSVAGLCSAIDASDGDTVMLREPPPADPPPGTRAELLQGCDKRFGTCVARFANAANFRGEPHLPGNDLLVRHAG